MFGKMFENFGDFDANKVMEVVNLVWNNREKIMDLIERLPELLDSTGDSIESAGQSALKASSMLVGGRDQMSAGQLSDLAANALERCHEELSQAAGIMAHFGQEIDDIRIPSIKPNYTKVAGFNVVSGLDFGELPLIDNAAERLKNGSGRLSDISDDLKTVAKHLRELGGTLTEAGQDLNNVGNQLVESGKTLRSVTQFSKK